MRFYIQQFIRTIMMAVFAVFFLRLHVTGELARYVNPKYDGMSQLAAVIFVFLTFIQFSRIWKSKKDNQAHCSKECSHHHGDDHSFLKKVISYVILIFPLLTGFSLPPQTLNSSLAENKGTLLSEGQSLDIVQESDDHQYFPAVENTDKNHNEKPLPNNNYLQEEAYQKKMKTLEDVHSIDMNEDIFSSYYEVIRASPRDFVGKNITLQGFIYREEGLHSNQLVISRFLITHCIADASVIGLLTEFEQASSYEKDTWMEIEGTLDVTTHNGAELPIIKAKRGRVIKEPSNPYIYPVLRKMTD
ncbi:TIGR03943 family putative permease subunit [Alteribacillus bidgolensis]|uniref:Putative membrane protein n=1 Tax=Alteribacillus bidgolensis TaxID=930129 RepID=A0A1G8FYI0_9BACI|nr:TIGR03943 family protein [Alteribacillus bidgolensis]SDH87120.1 putative membrane protein [Alteribacillus bidgolensis]